MGGPGPGRLRPGPGHPGHLYRRLVLALVGGYVDIIQGVSMNFIKYALAVSMALLAGLWLAWWLFSFALMLVHL